MNDDELLFIDDEENNEESNNDTASKWKILIVDDDVEVHNITKLVLKGFQYLDKGLEFIQAYSAKEAKEILLKHHDIALVLLDVVMEYEHAGLDLVKVIREEMKNSSIRIILRTGQPGVASQVDVISNYDINDYIAKTELSAQKLFSIVIAGLRAYNELISLEESRQKLLQLNQTLADKHQHIKKALDSIENKGVSLDAREALREQEQYTEMLFDTKDSIVVVIKNDELIALNDKFYEEFPYKDLEAFTSWHKCICDLFIQREGYLYKGDQRNWYKDILLSPHKTHKALMKNRNNESIVYSVTAKQTQLNEDSYIVAHFYDITELEEAKLAAQSALEAKGNFLANMSHEIRTPMNGILGFVDLMQNTQLDDNQTKYMSTIKNSTNTLLTIINDILDFSKLDSNKLEIEYIPADIKALSANVFSILKPLALKKSLKCNLEMDEDLAPCLLLDSTRLSQILTNLSSNAIKFTPDNGSVINRVKVIKTTHSSQTILFEVIDTGIGIALENQEKIFKAFSQENDSTTRKFGGTGLGLSISVQLVESMGGKLEVESTQGEGSRFYFTLELQRCSQAEAKEKRESNKGAQIAVSLKDKNILIAEDYDINRMLMENILEPEGAKVSFAHDGAEAVSMVRENDNYDIIFMDINMPVMNGIDATHALREELGCEVPIIALTANAIEGDKERFIAEGMSDYLSKPINIDALNRVLTQWLPVMQHETQEQTQEEASFSLEEVIVATQKSLGMDESIIIKMLQRLAESIDTTLEELESAIQMQEYETIAAIAHKLKGTAGSLNLTPLYKWLIKLEEMALSESSGDYLGLYGRMVMYLKSMKESVSTQ